MYHDVVIDDVVTQNGSNEVYFCINSMFFIYDVTVKNVNPPFFIIYIVWFTAKQYVHVVDQALSSMYSFFLEFLSRTSTFDSSNSL